LLYGVSIENGSSTSSKLDMNNLHLLDLDGYSLDEEYINLNYDVTGLHNLHDILLYSPRSLDNSYDKLLFIFYQLLKLSYNLHLMNIHCGEIKLNDIYIDKNYWIRVKLPFDSILNSYEEAKYNSNEDIEKINIISKNKTSLIDELLLSAEKIELDDESNNNSTNNNSIQFYSIKENLNSRYESFKHLNTKELANITKHWCNNKLTNFDYLLILNCVAGRQLDCPFNHPIFPWISDFESFNTNLRDLSVSKFRLNKGDAHLDLIYQASLSNGDPFPYHLTEFLSEITYFVYKSRVTDKETLCKHVRRTWVPNEYPSSMNRLYLWTPEECIPEFYCDASLFSSIHDDLPDLKVPDWCNGSVEEFVRTHRLLLDSDAVSKKLHSWIDLVFGYKVKKI
jgi:WD repeat-containing protein 81